jgi:alpha-tubulin suppressor-like RCC1 family protein
MNARNIIIGSTISALSLAGILILRSFTRHKKPTKKTTKRKSNIIVRGWGSNSAGQMSLGFSGPGPNYVVSILEINNLQNLKLISSGPYHTLVLTQDGKLFGCGSNSYSKLCCDENTSSVQHLRYLDCISNVIDVAAGPTFCVALTGDGKVWSWGSNNRGTIYAAFMTFCRSIRYWKRR